MIKFGICHFSLPVEGPYALKIASEAGFDGVQLDMISNYKNQLALSKDIVQKAFLFLGEKYNIEFPSIAVRELDRFSMVSEDNSIAVDAINKAIEAAVKMKIPIVLVPSFENSDIKSDTDLKQAVKVLKNACDKALESGIIIAAENLLSPMKIEELFKQTNRPNLKLYFDTQNHYLHKGYKMADLLERLMQYVCEVHVKDGKNGNLSGALLGEGDAGFYESIEVLKKHNYSGWIISENYYDLEPLSLQNDNPVELMKEDLKILKKAMGIS
ncbi:MAG: sugar phosphate isomerase/epimerase [Actinobacteria bacterium]|nr:sugar phosphate isomerase/epimerase [Actinomycetota bacterium]MBM3712327.1 sugar phosphate isomerase/epimerase [Actinomycetota bacterium]